MFHEFWRQGLDARANGQYDIALAYFQQAKEKATTGMARLYCDREIASCHVYSKAA